jgi:hypothetical protein
MKKDLIYSNQQSLYGAKEVLGFGADNWYIKEIERDLAYEIIIKNHYSKKGDSIAHNKINLGVFIEGELLGVLQYGYAMNPASCGSVVEGTDMDQYLELNRMWLDDKAERNSESKAVAYSLRYIRSKFPKIKWIQSFADERCGGFGIVYQACNFGFYGLHVSTFWEIEGEVYHNSIITNNKRKAKAKLEKKLQNAKKMELRQFRYLFFIDKRWKKKCLLQEKPYPKFYNE